MRRLTKAIALTAALMAGPALAQETTQDTELGEAVAQNEAIANNSSFGNWLLNCEAVTTADIRCRLIQQLSRSDDNALIVRMVVLPAGDGTHLLLAQTPIGVYLPGGAVYRFAENDTLEQRQMIWQRCAGQLCEAAIRIDAEELVEFEKHETLLFGYRTDVASDPIIVGVDISQFGDAVKALGMSGAN